MLNIQGSVKPDFSCQDALECFFNLNLLESASYRILVKDGPLSANELGETLGKDRSTSYRALKTLTTVGLCFKETKNLDQGGYYHVYRALNPSEVKEEIQQMIDAWYEKMNQAIGHFDDFEKELKK